MNKFKFVIMGAANIANKFCDAVKLIDDCEVVAVASRSMERATLFAEKNNIKKAYDSYEIMLQETEADCVYIAVTQDAHFDLSMLCLDYKMPVLCEKAMFMSSRQAEIVFERAKELGVFVMEAMWSRFLPAIRTAKQWIVENRIGAPVLVEASIGFRAPKDNQNRYFNPKLGGGVALDITVYAYELTTYLLDQRIRDYTVQAIWSESGVDVTNQISIRFEKVLATLHTSFLADIEEKITIYGECGKIIIPTPHYSSESFLYGDHKELICHYKDNETQNGFIYEIIEVIECIRKGKIESPVVPHELTLQCARLFDDIYKKRM